MYCKYCGSYIDDNSPYCKNCGAQADNKPAEYTNNDGPNFWFALLGFIFPIIGLILFIIYEDKRPKRAKSAGKGALVGFITKVVLAIILVILYLVYAASLFNNINNDTETYTPEIGDVFIKETTDEILNKYVDVTFGEFEVTNNGYFPVTSLDVTVKNKADKQYTYFITIEAIDSNGARIETDTVYADRLGSGQEIYLKVFEYIDQEKLDQFESASFRVLEINKYSS